MNMNNTSLRFLTWGTALAALVGAVLLSGEDAGLPELVARGHFGQVPRGDPSQVFSVPRREAPAAVRSNSSGAAH